MRAEGRERTGWSRIRILALRAWVMELGGYVAIYRFVFRRPRVPAGAQAFSYHQPVILLLGVIVVVSVVELVALDLLLRRWEAVRIPLLVLSLWGVVWMLGLLFGMLTRPHAVGPEGLRARYATEIDLALPWAEVTGVAARTRRDQDKQPMVTVDDAGGGVLHLRMQHETNLEVRLAEPRTFSLPNGPETVGQIDLWADDPQAFLAAVRRFRPGPAA